MMQIDIKKIKRLIELLENSSISEIEMKEGEVSVRLSRQGPAYTPVAQYIEKPEIRGFNETASLPANASTEAPPTEKTKVETGHVIRSPMVGTFYSSASPDSKAFVTIGQSIKSGDVLCIVEAMKMFNEIESDRAGVIVDILVKNGEPIEYNQPLFVIE